VAESLEKLFRPAGASILPDYVTARRKCYWLELQSCPVQPSFLVLFGYESRFDYWSVLQVHPEDSDDDELKSACRPDSLWVKPCPFCLQGLGLHNSQWICVRRSSARRSQTSGSWIWKAPGRVACHSYGEKAGKLLRTLCRPLRRLLVRHRQVLQEIDLVKT